MSLLGTILHKIFHPHEAQANPQITPAEVPKPPTPVDVSAVLNGMAQSHKEKLNWNTSIVDLLKLLNLDNSLTARKELAKELHFTGDTNDTATMNTWLIKEVMKKLAENGGHVPPELHV